ncbi:oxidoreductase [Rhodoferax lacus]|uniref:Oxidoreductase n=1 Tax=Rhodoferax lacus TaxID=2184758 RepID=A0A3E1R7F0_9BURK|nr:PDR/VanB family oxidoreductase [Rhodoferax lacus]RFO95247.1 oxidoreductase [Rhodoferax lacus]
MNSPTIAAVLQGMRLVAENVISLELRAADSTFALPPFEPGAHIDLHLPNGLVRSYSLTNPGAAPDCYQVAVLHDRNSRGGSRHIHEQLRVGTPLGISAPRNLFKLNEDAEHSFLLAGGIGITPLYAMVQRLAQLGRSADLVVCARNRGQLSFLKELQALVSPQLRLHLHLDEEAGGPPDLRALLGAHGPDTHFYCCGPHPMLQAFEDTCAALNLPHVHLERFAAAPTAAAPMAAPRTYTVRLQKSGQVLEVSTARPLLDSLLAAGVDAGHSCREGICGACETPVLEGEIDHRDSILSQAERDANRSMMVCVSHCRSAHLVLDL